MNINEIPVYAPQELIDAGIFEGVELTENKYEEDINTKQLINN
jgi:hypothetical protein